MRARGSKRLRTIQAQRWSVCLFQALMVIYCPALSFADIPAYVAIGIGPHSLSRTEAIEVFKAASAYIQRDTGLVITAKRFKVYHKRNIDLSRAYLGITKARLMLQNMRHKTLGLKLRREINFAFLPPTIDRVTGYWYSAGAAYICGSSNGMPGFVFATDKNPLGETRILDVTLATAHELGHLLGAQHDNVGPPYTIMNYAVMQWTDTQSDFHFSSKSIGEISECQK